MGGFDDYGDCNVNPCPKSGQDCVFAEWTTYGECSSACAGVQRRTRGISVQKPARCDLHFTHNRIFIS